MNPATGGSRWLTLAAMVGLGFLGTAAERCRHGQNGDPKAPPVLVAIYMNAYPVNLQEGTTFQLAAIGGYSNGALVPGEPVTWVMPANAFATMTPVGYITAVAEGSTTVTATSVKDPLIAKVVAVNVSKGPPPAPTFTSPTQLPDSMANTQYTYHLLTAGGQSPLVFMHIGGEFPPGFSMATDGTITGNCPDAQAPFDADIRITVTDANGLTGTADFKLHVSNFHT